MTRKTNPNLDFTFGNFKNKTTRDKNGKQYLYLSSRVMYNDPVTGMRKEKQFTGKNKHEVQEKINAFIQNVQSVAEKNFSVSNQETLEQTDAEKNSGVPSNQETLEQTLGEWLKKWESIYLSGVSSRTKKLYASDMRLYITPVFGDVPLSALMHEKIQVRYNELASQKKQKGDGILTYKTRKDIAGVFHKALQEAVDLHMIPFNPASHCKIPMEQAYDKNEMHPLDKKQLAYFLTAIGGHVHEYLYFVDVFTGMRQGEILGLTWDCVNFDKNTIRIEKQQSKDKDKDGNAIFSLPKYGKKRTIVVAPEVMEKLKLQQKKQIYMKSAVGEAWNNENNLVFTNKTGGFLSYRTVYDCFKRVMKKLDYVEVRFHDLRHTYATMSLQNGDDIKTLSENMGHSDVAFTLRIYGHSNEDMKQTCANNMESLIKEIA